jgi:hypothetical protein
MSILRAAIVSLLCVGAAVCMRLFDGHLPWQLWMPTGLLVAAAVLAHHHHTASQLLVRAILWSNLLLGVVVAWVGNGRERSVAAALAVATGLAIFALGRRGLDGDARGDRFAPIAFRSTLVAILVMALADAQTLMLFGSLSLAGPWPHTTSGVSLLVLSGALLASIVGIYLMRVWGLLFNIAACVGIIVAVVAGAFYLPTLIQAAFIATAALQLLLLFPLFLALFTGAERRPPALSRRGVWLGSIAVAALMVVAVMPAIARLV